MEKRTLSVVKRTSVGKNPLKALRKEGLLPAVMYGHSGNVLFSVNTKEFGKKFNVISENKIVDLKDGEDVYHVLIKDFQENVLKGEIMHIDFYEVEKGKVLHTTIPVHFTGSSVGVQLGGNISHNLHEIPVACLPKDIPESIEVNVDALNIGDSLHVSDLSEIKGVEFLIDGEQVVTHVSKANAEVEEPSVEEEVVVEGSEAE